MKIADILASSLLFLLIPALTGQEKLTLEAGDGLQITADKYFLNDTLPWILMFHHSGSSRGEFREIAPRFNMLGYNGLAVDLRHGREANFIFNETARAAREGNFRDDMQDALADVVAALKWAEIQNETPVILLGSSYSASLVLMVAKKSPRAGAVIAFSPGEFFGTGSMVREKVTGLEKPVFIAATARERPYTSELSSGIDEKHKTLFSPSGCSGAHGARALWESEECSDEYWLALLLFFNNLKNKYARQHSET